MSASTARRVVLGGLAFYLLAAGMLLATTVGHEYSHYAAHEGFEPAPIRFYGTPEQARADLVHTTPMQIDGRTYRVENVQRTTIVIYEDALVYAFTLNLAPMFLYHDGTLGATYMHTDAAQTTSRVRGGDGTHDHHWSIVMGAPIAVAGIGLALGAVWLAWTRSVASRAVAVAFASEMGNNAHHAAELGVDATFYTLLCQVVFAAAVLAAILVSATYRQLVFPPPSPSPSPAKGGRPAVAAPLRFSRAGPLQVRPGNTAGQALVVPTRSRQA